MAIIVRNLRKITISLKKKEIGCHGNQNSKIFKNDQNLHVMTKLNPKFHKNPKSHNEMPDFQTKHPFSLSNSVGGCPHFAQYSE